MPRPIWDGEITFGLINIPVHLYSAEKANDLAFHMLDAADESRIRNERVNETTGKPVPWDRIVKGYELESGRYVILTKEDFEAADLHGTHAIDLQGFVDVTAIAPIYYKKPYYLTPGKAGEKGYGLLLETLKRAGKAGLATFVLRTREYLGLVLPMGDILVLMTLRFEEEIAAEPAKTEAKGKKAAARKAAVSDREVTMAENLVDAMSIDWDPAAYHDEYKAKLLAWIEKKAKAKAPLRMPKPKPAGEGGQVVDMFDLLKRSLNQSGRGRGKAAAAAAPKRETRGRRASASPAGRTSRRANTGRRRAASTTARK